MYAIAFDFDTDLLARHFPGNTPTNAYAMIGRVFHRHGFSWQQGSVYFGNEHVNAVSVFKAIEDAKRVYPWFARVVRDIRMLRIEENNDLMPLLDLELDLGPPSKASAAE